MVTEVRAIGLVRTAEPIGCWLEPARPPPLPAQPLQTKANKVADNHKSPRIAITSIPQSWSAPRKNAPVFVVIPRERFNRKTSPAVAELVASSSGMRADRKNRRSRPPSAGSERISVARIARSWRCKATRHNQPTKGFCHRETAVAYAGDDPRGADTLRARQRRALNRAEVGASPAASSA